MNPHTCLNLLSAPYHGIQSYSICKGMAWEKKWPPIQMCTKWNFYTHFHSPGLVCLMSLSSLCLLSISNCSCPFFFSLIRTLAGGLIIQRSSLFSLCSHYAQYGSASRFWSLCHMDVPRETLSLLFLQEVFFFFSSILSQTFSFIIFILTPLCLEICHSLLSPEQAILYE